ncbi:hypothetical protein [Rubripirellula reticaptiva]|uniref:DUF5666 domain-containing protein n=1 Tax=Rubripirellula reticaptiva TaxID=2528013 RepID=A0A5C6F7D7_9BACT|nr:hypothetical protein [Rubripirellula reticaptiva]TWU56357.1 hypothetical protein Poly59_26610 [Rubripirellula reticaptiva]
MQRAKFTGTIEAVGNGRLTLRDDDESPIDFIVSPQARILRDEKLADLDELQTDDVAIITAEESGGQMNAMNIFVMEPQSKFATCILSI